MKNKKNIYLMYAIALLQGMVFYGPIATLYRQAQGLTIFDIAITESVAYLLCILLEVPWGIIADKIGYKKTMVFCCGLYFVSKLVMWQADQFADFLLERILLSIVLSGFSGVDTSILYLSCEEDESQKVFGIYNGCSVAGLLSASLIFSVFLGDRYRATALLTMITYGAAAILSLCLTEVRDDSKEPFSMTQFRDCLTRTFKNRRLLLFLAAVALVTQASQSITVFLNQLQYEKCGLSPSAIGYIYIFVTLAGLLGVFSHKLTATAGIKRTGLILQITATAACFVLAFTANALFSVCCVLLLRLSDCLFQPYQMQLQNKQVQTLFRATELSIYAMFVDSIGTGTSLAFGYLAKLSLPYAFLFCGVSCVVGLTLFFIWHHHYAKDTPYPAPQHRNS